MVDRQRSGRATIPKFLGIASTAPRLDPKASLTLSARAIAGSPPTESFGGCVPVTHPFMDAEAFRLWKPTASGSAGSETKLVVAAPTAASKIAASSGKTQRH